MRRRGVVPRVASRTFGPPALAYTGVRMSTSRRPVAFDALTPLALFERSVRVFPDQPAVVYGDSRAS